MTGMFLYVASIGASLSASTINYLIATAVIVVLLIIGLIQEVRMKYFTGYYRIGN